MSLYLNGLRPKLIAEQLGVSPQTIQTWRIRYKWKSKADSLANELSKADKNLLAMELAKKSQYVRTKLAEDIESTVDRLPPNPTSIKDYAKRQQAIQAIVDNARKVFGWDDSNESSNTIVSVDLSTIQHYDSEDAIEVYDTKKACLSGGDALAGGEGASLSDPPLAGRGSDSKKISDFGNWDNERDIVESDRDSEGVCSNDDDDGPPEEGVR